MESSICRSGIFQYSLSRELLGDGGHLVGYSYGGVVSLVAAARMCELPFLQGARTSAYARGVIFHYTEEELAALAV
jgi:hypothetical protein